MMIDHLLRCFEHGRLAVPEQIHSVYERFAELALDVAGIDDGPETEAALRRLLESRDCAVRAALMKDREAQRPRLVAQ